MDSGAQLSLNNPISKSGLGLTVHNSRTIFEEADYFARNYLYKLMPINFEAVNETIIHMEHDYCNFGSFSSDNLNKMTHAEAEERNYKKRKIKCSSIGFSSPDHELSEKESVAAFVKVTEGFVAHSKSDEDYSMPIQPLDLSLPVFHEEKTEKLLKESQSNIRKTKSELKSSTDVIQFNVCESNKENVTSSARKIEVTISRPGQKEYYQPCQVFLNDVARISPDLIKNDCYEIEIIDRTGKDLDKEKTRLYYIVSESTWQTFENSSERIILTNDLNIGKPIQDNENSNKPTYVIFDRYSLTESLAKMCEKKGGSFKYTCIEESVSKIQENRREVQDCGHEFAINRIPLEEENCKKYGEKNVDTDLRHMTETNILKRLLLRDQKNIKTESDFNMFLETSDKSKVMGIETEEKILNNSEFISTGAITEETKPNLMQSEPQMPSRFNQDHVKTEIYKTHEEIHTGKIETENRFKNDLKLKFGDKERKDNEALMKKSKRKKIQSQNNRIILSNSIVRVEKNKSVIHGFDNADAKKKKSKCFDINEEKKLFNCQVDDVNFSSKRVTRLSVSLMNEGQNMKNLRTIYRDRGKKKCKLQSFGIGKEKVEAEGGKKTTKTRKKVSIFKYKTSVGNKKKLSVKESSTVMEVVEREKSKKGKSKKEYLPQFDNENQCFEKRETRSTAKKRAAENIRRTRMRNAVDVSLVKLNKSSIRKR